jgi:hypothetical protein
MSVDFIPYACLFAGFDHDGCEADELLLSEFLLSLQHGSAAHHQDVSISGSGPTAVPRSFAKRTIKGSAAAIAGKVSAAAVRRTVVHRRKRRDDLAGPCNHCGALSSPQWRKGPKGKPVLCNACGIRFLRNRTLTKVMVSTYLDMDLQVGRTQGVGVCTTQHKPSAHVQSSAYL